MEGKSGKGTDKVSIPYREELDAVRHAHCLLVKSMMVHYGNDAHGRLLCAAALHSVHASMMNFELEILASDVREGKDGKDQPD